MIKASRGPALNHFPSSRCVGCWIAVVDLACLLLLAVVGIIPPGRERKHTVAGQRRNLTGFALICH